MFRKCSKSIRRIMVLLVAILAASYMMFNLLAEYRSHVIPLGQSRESKNAMFIDNDFTTVMSNIKFTQQDMTDEFGKPYKIIIWIQEKGVPVYKANPSVCKANITCQITFDESDHSSAHAIVFKANHIKEDHLPSSRQPSQLFTWWADQNPLDINLVPNLDNYFNLTFHYRTDADVYAPFGSIHLLLRELKSNAHINFENLLSNKRNDKVAVWTANKCSRDEYLFGRNLISMGLKVDTFGSCFNQSELGKGRFSKKFRNEISKYKFNLVFENPLGCKDYFTQEFWYDSLRNGVVPVVWGSMKEDILKVAPTKSFVHANDFQNATQLVKYLNELTNNETAYAEYLKWRTWPKHPENIESRLRLENRDYDLRGFCKLCSLVQKLGKRRKMNLSAERKIIHSLQEAWWGHENENCLN